MTVLIFLLSTSVYRRRVPSIYNGEVFPTSILHFSDRSALRGFSPRMPISELAGCPK